MSLVTSKSRTANYLRQFKGALGFRLGSVIVSILTVPVLIKYLGQEGFGVWSTLLAFTSWLTLLDLGLANGLRNKVAESLAINSPNTAKYYVGSSYMLLALIALLIWAVLNVGIYFVSWQTIFNTTLIEETSLRLAVQIAVLFTLVNLSLGLVGALLGAAHKTSLVFFGQLLSNLILLTSVLVFFNSSEGQIGTLALINGISLVLANIVLSFVFYKSQPQLWPFMRLDIARVRPLLASSFPFFVIQLAVLVIFTTDKLLITQFFGPEQVAQYEVVLKLFSLVILVHGLISLPLWSAYTDAYARRDFAWIKRMLRTQLLIFFVILIAIALMIILAPTIIRIWLGDSFFVSIQLIVATGIFVAISIWNNIFATFVNGIGQLRVQLYAAIFAMLINIPVSIFLVNNTNLGVSAIIIGTCSSLLIAGISLPIQVKFIIRSLKTRS
jgi:O-antigen/teichoic acid export membrane protein